MTRETNMRCIHHNMAAIGGYVAAYTLLCRNFMGNAQTNNLITIFFDLESLNLREAAARIGGLLLYILATASYVLVSKKTRWNPMYYSLSVDCLAIVLLGLIPENVYYVFGLYPAFFAMALQWNAFPGAYGYVSSTIFSTNNVKQATLSLTEYLVDHKADPKKKHRGLFFVTSLLFFHVGVTLSYVFTHLLGIHGIWMALALAVPAFFLIRRDGKYAKELS